MLVKTYNNLSSKNTINKEIEEVGTIDIKFKDRTNITKPILVTSGITEIDFDYIYIDKFKRYYFVGDVEVVPNRIKIINLECDVLMTYKDDILNTKAIVKRQTKFNDYYNSGFSSEVTKEVDLYKSDVIVEDEKSNILVTIGGVK